MTTPKVTIWAALRGTKEDGVSSSFGQTLQGSKVHQSQGSLADSARGN